MASRIPRRPDRHQRLAAAHNIALGPSPTEIQQPLTAHNRFYRAA